MYNYAFTKSSALEFFPHWPAIQLQVISSSHYLFTEGTLWEKFLQLINRVYQIHIFSSKVSPVVQVTHPTEAWGYSGSWLLPLHCFSGLSPWLPTSQVHFLLVLNFLSQGFYTFSSLFLGLSFPAPRSVLSPKGTWAETPHPHPTLLNRTYLLSVNYLDPCFMTFFMIWPILLICLWSVPQPECEPHRAQRPHLPSLFLCLQLPNGVHRMGTQ